MRKVMVWLRIPSNRVKSFIAPNALLFRVLQKNDVAQQQQGNANEGQG